MQNRSFRKPWSWAKCPDWLEKKCGVGVSMRRGLGRVSMSLRRTAVRVLCLRLLWPAQTGCESTAVHLRQSTGFTRSAFFYSQREGRKGESLGRKPRLGWGDRRPPELSFAMGLHQLTGDSSKKVFPTLSLAWLSTLRCHWAPQGTADTHSSWTDQLWCSTQQCQGQLSFSLNRYSTGQS